MPTEPTPRAFTRLCLEFSEAELDKPQEANDFLQRYREQLGLAGSEGSLLSLFLRRVWPEGVPATLIASNVSFKRQYPQWLLRPVSWGPEAGSYAAAHQTLGMQAYRRQGRLVVKRFEVTPHVPPRGHELVISAPLVWNPRELYMGPEDLDVLSRLPFHREETSQRLESWREYLHWKEELVKQLQIKVPYLAWKWVDEHRLAFLIRYPAPGNRRLDGQELSALPPEEEEDEQPAEQPRKPRRREADPVALGEVERIAAIQARDERARQLWAHALRDGESTAQVIIRVEEDQEERLRQKQDLIPARGMLVSSIAGDLAPLRNQVNAINRLQNSQGFCPRLADFLFSATSASLPAGPLPELAPLPGTRALNPGQVEAIAKALAAPDLCLVQGPPGTGKTTVIAELCLRVTAEKGRVLVASQTNLAVDNALSRLADKPNIRRLRLGNADRVDEDYQDFLADKVVDRWFSTISEACAERIEQASHLERELAQAQQWLNSLQRALKAHDEAQAALEDLQERLGATELRREPLVRRTHDVRKRKDATHRQVELLRALQAWADGSPEPPPASTGIDVPELTAVLRDVREHLPPQDPARALEGVALLAALVDRRRDLEALRGHLKEGWHLHEGGLSGGAQTELLALLAERQRISLSEDEADAARLPALNKRIKQLQGAAWSRVTQQLALLSSKVWGASAPLPVQRITDALQPSKELVPAFEALDALVTQALEASERVLQARPELSRAFGRRAEQALVNKEQAEHDAREAEAELARLEAWHAELLERQRGLQQEVATAGTQWSEVWRALHPTGEQPPEAPSFRSFQAESERQQAVHRDTAAQLEHRSRWREIQKEWRQRLGRVSESDREELQRLYVQHANVVGMTCNEAGKKNVFQHPAFQPFDMVIIDEVSKATPTELIMPMLLGRKVVLVGDHRQLPPMFRENEASFAEAQAEGQIDSATFHKYQRMVTASLFQELFEAAPAELKSMLWVQYRMHPQVMDAVNQFYGGRLQPGAEPGAPEPRKKLDARRQHHLVIPDGHGGKFLEPQQHLLWVDSSRDAQHRPHWEEQRGTSKLNPLEVNLVLETLRRLNVALWERGYGQSVELRAERAEAGMTMRDFVRKRLAAPPDATLDDLFGEKRIRVGGRSQKPERIIQAGETIQVDARRQVGVLTFYGAQLKALREAIDRERNSFDAMDLRTNTVDRFQGMERPIVIASLVRSMRGHMGEFVRQFQRINVGLSRAQELLIIIGAAETFKRALIELPPLDPREGKAAEKKAVYQSIFDLAVRAGGRRHARQLLSP